MKIVMELKNCAEEPPEHDGVYNVFTLGFGGRLDVNHGECDYTVEGGWNTWKGYYGLHDEYRMKYEENPNIYWAEKCEVLYE